MITKVESFTAGDGKLFPTEHAAHMHEIEQALKRKADSNPRLRSSISVILEEADWLATVLAPLFDLSRPPGEVERPPVVLRAARG